MNDLESEWEQMAPYWIKEMREGRNATREIQLDPPILDLCGDVTDKDVVDLGCGEGRFSRKLGAQGATVLGLDRSRTMIEAAMSIAGPAEEYRVADVQNLSFLEDASFDLAISYLNQCDLPDFAANTKEVFRILKPGGVFVIANLHPMRSATGLWCKDESGKKLHVTVDNYLESEKRHWKIMGVTITNFHRSLETYVMTYLDSGFKLERIEEPSVSNEALEQYPELDDEQRVPNFILFKLRR